MENKLCKRCGLEKPIERFYLLKKGGKYRQSYCIPCQNKHRHKKSPEWSENRRRSPKGRANQLFLSAQSRAKKKRLPFTLTRKRVLDAIEKGVCEVTGIEFDMSVGSGRQPFTPSIHQKEPGLGYEESNVQIVVWMHNAAAGTWGNDALKKYLKSFLAKK